jgi:hypothetical protein
MYAHDSTHHVSHPFVGLAVPKVDARPVKPPALLSHCLCTTHQHRRPPYPVGRARLEAPPR